MADVASRIVQFRDEFDKVFRNRAPACALRVAEGFAIPFEPGVERGGEGREFYDWKSVKVPPRQTAGREGQFYARISHLYE